MLKDKAKVWIEIPFKQAMKNQKFASAILMSNVRKLDIEHNNKVRILFTHDNKLLAERVEA